MFQILKSEGQVSLSGLQGSLETLFLQALSNQVLQPVCVLYTDEDKAEWMTEELSLLLGENQVAYFPGSMDAHAPTQFHVRQSGAQMEVLRDLSSSDVKVVVTDVQGFLSPLPAPARLHEERIELKAGATYPFSDLVEKLIDFGYSRETMVERPGEISVRGGILDVFPFTGEKPHRVEFWGDEIESIRQFHVDTQRSDTTGHTLTLIPAPDAWQDCESSLLDYFPDKSPLFLEDPERTLGLLSEAKTSPFSNIKLDFASHPVICHETLHISNATINIGGKPVLQPGRTIQEIRDSLTSQEQDSTFLFCMHQEQARRIEEFLTLDTHPIDRLWIGAGPVLRGFYHPDLRLKVYSDRDLFHKGISRKKPRRFAEGAPIREMSELKRGDFVVHIDYGIGRYMGLEKIEVRGVERECLYISYQDKDKLFVPVDKMTRVQKYSGKEGFEPRVTKLGTQKWERIKERTKKAVQAIATELIQLYSARQMKPGHAFSSDTTWEKELEASFAYEETPDQDQAIVDVKKDMMESRPMDRLICGDVGYGKTEVAVRAAFKAISDGKQVAVLVPTTILAQQHYATFQERLDRFPVEVEVLSRFRSRKQQLDIVDRLKAGKVDVVIGTHRLLSKDIAFKDLGLLVIDEEQRFGVKHKERLKSFRETVDVLALSATPIPRTLNMSMVGIRDMSLINTPPKDRMPIHTEVMPFSERVITEAIEHELGRQGQVFFVHNRIQSIHAMASMVQRLVPGIRLGVAHGQMPTHQLEEVMMQFTVGALDCLVSTMIVESGLDLPHVNTLIVNRADRLGLAQLYQLRGRVGRSNQRAFAYLFTPPFELLSPEAVKRLRTIEEFTELGSGIQVAMRDLEIRGAGNLLGMQQSGNIDAVGFELYTQLVREAVEELKAQETVPEEIPIQTPDCLVDMHVPAFIGGRYVSDENMRVNLYRKLAGCGSMEEVDAFQDELRDRFGPVPEETLNLLEATRLRLIGEARGMKRIFIDQKSLQIYFDEAWMERFEGSEQFTAHLRTIIDSTEGKLRFIEKKGFGLRTNLPEDDPLAYAKNILQRWG